MNARDRLDRIILPLALTIGTAARVVFALVDDGIHWPDEIYQSLEPAHRAVFGYGWQAWEFLEGARHWSFPGLVALVLKTALLFGLRSPAEYLPFLELFFCTVGTATIASTYLLSRSVGASRLSSALGAASFAFMGLAVYFAPRAMGETLSALPVTLAFALLLLDAPRRWHLVAAGVLLSLAVGFRLQNGLLCLGALGVLLARRRRTDALWLLGVLGLGALAYGLVDWLTWGKPFHSALVYLRFNVLEGRSSDFGRSPPWHYLRVLVSAEWLTVVPLVGLAVLGFRRHRALAVLSLVYLLAHSLIPHKELRFLFPLFPLLCAQAAVGLDVLSASRPRWAPAVAVGLSLASLLSCATLPALTFRRLGIKNPGPGNRSALDYAGAENRLLLFASALPDVCGLKISSIENWRTGGYTYFHQEVPLYGRERPNDGEGHYNYLIAPKGSVAGTEVAADGEVALVRLSPPPCAPDPGYDWHLE
ncbi:MAG: hypothetical protein ACOZIN_17530 [Myxococcota bacterium]